MLRPLIVFDSTMGKNKAKQPKEVNEEELKRFAGSSDEESVQKDEEDASASEHDEEEDDEMIPMKDEYDASAGESEEEEEQLVPKAKGTVGMADAMSRILGTTSSKESTGTQPVVLAKTKTPLQKQQEKERLEEQKMKERRKQNRELHLKAMHIPLSVATTSKVQIDADTDVAKELEQEKTLRRIATKGVVALFNAIHQHQRQDSSNGNEEEDATPNKTGAKVKNLTKHDFLDLIKSKAAKKTKESTEKVPQVEDDKPKKKWNAVQDDYLLNPKKNWDQESSSDEEQDEPSPVKKQKVKA